MHAVKCVLFIGCYAVAVIVDAFGLTDDVAEVIFEEWP